MMAMPEEGGGGGGADEITVHVCLRRPAIVPTKNMKVMMCGFC